MTVPGGPVLLAIFGAGASHGCQKLDPSDGLSLTGPDRSGVGHGNYDEVRPPLTQDLVRPGTFAARLLARYDGALPVVDAVRERLDAGGTESPTISLEQALAAYQELATQDPQVIRHLAALRFYLRDLLWACSEFMQSPTVGAGTTNHLTLIRELHTWAASTEAHVCLTSFNYDFILETACRRVWDFDPWALDHYVSYAPVSVVKPHGSVLWQWPLGGPEATATPHDIALQSISRAIEFAPEVENLEPCRTSPFENAQPVDVRRMSIPALALPVDGKSDLIWPVEQASHFGSIQARVSKLLIVGWRAAEAHFLAGMERLTSGAKAVIVTGGPNAVEEAEQIRERLWGRVLDITTDVQLATLGFTDFMRSGLLQWLLDD